MRLLRLISIFLFMLAVSTSSFARSFETPEALLKALYADSSGNYDYPYQPYLSRHLLALFKAERDAAPNEPSNMDWDPVIAGQDGAATNLNIGEAVIDGDRASVVVNFTNFQDVTLHYSLVREDGGWKVDDIEQKDGDFPWRVSRQISGQ